MTMIRRLVVVLAVTAAVLPAAMPASAITSQRLCPASAGLTNCAWNAVSQYLTDGTGGRFTEQTVGSVNLMFQVPFTPGTGYNRTYNGDRVVILQDALNGGCVWARYSTSSPAAYPHGGCGPSINADLFVVHGTWLVNVGESDYYWTVYNGGPANALDVAGIGWNKGVWCDPLWAHKYFGWSWFS